LGTGPADNPVSLSVAPIILTIAYVVIIPLGILYSGKEKDK
jgi:ABC-type microcin C transport system permease subunit YejB